MTPHELHFPKNETDVLNISNEVKHNEKPHHDFDYSAVGVSYQRIYFCKKSNRIVTESIPYHDIHAEPHPDREPVTRKHTTRHNRRSVKRLLFKMGDEK